MHTHAKIFPAQLGSQAVTFRHEENKLLFWDSVFKVTVLWGSASLAVCKFGILFDLDLYSVTACFAGRPWGNWRISIVLIQFPTVFRNVSVLFLFFLKKITRLLEKFLQRCFSFHSFVQRNAVLPRPSCYRIGSVREKRAQKNVCWDVKLIKIPFNYSHSIQEQTKDGAGHLLVLIHHCSGSGYGFSACSIQHFVEKYFSSLDLKLSS